MGHPNLLLMNLTRRASGGSPLEEEAPADLTESRKTKRRSEQPGCRGAPRLRQSE